MRIHPTLVVAASLLVAQSGCSSVDATAPSPPSIGSQAEALTPLPDPFPDPEPIPDPTPIPQPIPIPIPQPIPDPIKWPPIFLPLNKVTFHGSRERTGWNGRESALTPAAVSGPSFGHVWDSPVLDSVTLGSTTYAPHVYASPLYVESVKVPLFLGSITARVIYTATSNGYVYAVNAFPTTGPLGPVSPGAILWRRKLATPKVVGGLDGGLPLGVLSTPFIDLSASPPRMYVTAIDATVGWRAWALDITNGAVLPGWPVDLTDATIRPKNLNGTSAHFDADVIVSQRGALNVSVDGSLLYVPFGAYSDGGIGWLVAVDTAAHTVKYAYSSDPTTRTEASGGIWSAGGASIDSSGRLFAATGNSPVSIPTGFHVWGQSVLQFTPSLGLSATYTPFNYCAMDVKDIDVAGSSPLLFDESAASTSTPHLLVVGSKQGSLYLLDRDHLPGGTAQRPGCSTISTTDGSLLSPFAQPQFGARGPINVFGPYTDAYGNLDYAKMRTTPAFFRDASGTPFIVLSGATKASASSQTSVAPSVARVRVVTSPGHPAYLSVDRLDGSHAFLNPGSPVVSSNGGNTPVVWVIDENAKRVASLLDPAAPHPILYALDGTTLAPLWHTPVGQLSVGGKYTTPLVARGRVFVATDRIQAYGLP